MTSLAVVIVSWNVRDRLARCLESLFADLDSAPIDSRVVVVDNASSDGSPVMIRSRFPRVELIARDDNLGFARGNNFALQSLGLGDLSSPPVHLPLPKAMGRPLTLAHLPLPQAMGRLSPLDWAVISSLLDRKSVV